MSHYLQTIDQGKRRHWKEFYACSRHQEDELKNYLINRIHRICPGFKYLIDFEWEVKSKRGKGDLIFGSDYGVYLIIETKFLNTESGKTAQVSRHDARLKVKEQAERYKEIATERFYAEAVKIIGATFTNEDNKIHFLDGDEKIARFVSEAKLKIGYL
ncbi:11949_t:CDS:2 [Ambispora gerdemannii]|uniref:11949_t:CDS:1 n=1 Tax=Ambispora gerdemannii TaxID=144530 RepID=A0A9N8ZWB2_9GLOM|nr:11949_t:CDS:2 [Ambispora gerdemannii]